MSQSSQASSYSNTNINNESPISNTIQNRELSKLLRNDSRFRPILNRILRQERIRASQLVAVLRSLPWMNPSTLFTNNRSRSRLIYASIRRNNVQNVVRVWSRPGHNRLVNITPSLRRATREYLLFNSNISRSRELIRSAVHAMERTETSFNSPFRPGSRRRRINSESSSNNNSNNFTNQSSQNSSENKMNINQWRKSIR
jgi:hypothetical protein